MEEWRRSFKDNDGDDEQSKTEQSLAEDRWWSGSGRVVVALGPTLQRRRRSLEKLQVFVNKRGVTRGRVVVGMKEVSNNDSVLDEERNLANTMQTCLHPPETTSLMDCRMSSGLKLHRDFSEVSSVNLKIDFSKKESSRSCHLPVR